jgi:translation initiation factor eIF-2B subunit alpha
VSELQASGIPCAAVLDSAVGFILDKVDMIFVGAEGVVENGGIINQVRSYAIS